LRLVVPRAAQKSWAARLAARGQNRLETWFDTPERALSRAGLTLSTLRRGRSWRLRLQTPTALLEVPSPAAIPVPAALGPEWAESLTALMGDARLEPQFTAALKRVTTSQGGVSLTLETGTLTTQTAKLPVSALVIEGPEAQAAKTALALAAEHGLPLDPEPLPQRGARLVTDAPPPVVRAGPGLSGHPSLDDAIILLVRSCLTQFTANWQVFFTGDTVNAIHQMRVAMRRLRSVLGLFARALPAPEFAGFRAEAKHIAATMGEARNWDVFTSLVKAGPGQMFGAEPGFAELYAQCAAQRAQGYQAVSDLLASPRPTLFVLALEEFLARRGWRGTLTPEALPSLAAPATGFATLQLTRLHRKVRKRGRHLRHLPAPARHLLRIELKKLRYAADLFGGLYEPKSRVRVYAEAAANLQEALGTLNDLATAQTLLARLDQSSPQTAHAAGIVTGWCAHAALAADRPLLKRWKEFLATKPFAG
jgi:CHAD domain-containing protein